MSYTHMAAVYDRLMADMPYEKWIAFAEQFWARHGQPSSVIDLGCGTGSIAIPLSQKGYRVFGVDLSEEMLAIAYEKMQQVRGQVTWVQQDMCKLSLPQVDSVISFCDSMSYLVEEQDVKETIQRAYDHLRPGGSFLFDVHSPYKILHIFGNHTFTYLEEDVNYVWQCFTDEERLEVEHQLTFFLRQEGRLYKKLEEDHLQRAYQPTQMVSWLREAGFDEITLTADFEHAPPHAQSERLFFSAKRPHD